MDQPVSPPQPEDPRPGVLKVFGIMHIVLGVVGVIGGLLTVGSQLAARAMFETLGETMGEEAGAEFVTLTMEYTRKLSAVTYFDLAARLFIAVLIIVAGVALLKSRRNSVKKSNIYAFVSIGLKALMLVIVVVLVVPATNQYYDALAQAQEAAGAAQPAGMAQVQKVAGTASQIVAPIISMIYPALALILLNRKPVREWLGKHGT